MEEIKVNKQKLLDLLKQLKCIIIRNNSTTWSYNHNAVNKLTKEIIDQIYRYTQFVEYDASVADRIKFLMWGYNEQPKCVICGNIITISHNKIKKTCGRKCGFELKKQTSLKKYGVENPMQCSEILKKAKQTNLKKFGVENPSQASCVKQKRKNTFIAKYGVTHPMQCTKVQEKQKQTMLDRYGVKNPQQHTEIKAKTKETNLKKYGSQNPMQCTEVQEKQKQTMLDRYGVEHSSQSPELYEKTKQTNLKKYGVQWTCQSPITQEKQKQTNLKKYGVEHPLQSPKIRRKIKQTILDRYGVNNPAQQHLSQDAINKLNDKRWLKDQHINQKKSHTEIANQLGYAPSTVSNACAKFNIPTQYYFQSIGEKQVVEYLQTITNTKIITNDRSLIAPHELDIVIHEFNLAIEYNGIYWHSELAGKDRTYHLNKSKLVNDQQYHLIHLYDMEWEQQQDIVKSRLASFVHANKTIYARKCSIIEVSNSDQKIFFDLNHIQRGISAQYAYGLVYDDQLVAVMSFGNSRFNKKYQWELLRYANTLSINVVGGASRLFNYFIKKHNPTSIISYSDNRWNRGELYKTIGFQFSHKSEPNYHYFNSSHHLFSRNMFQKHKLKKKLKTFDPNLTEWENMQLNGYNRIWDCGNNVYVWKK